MNLTVTINFFINYSHFQKKGIDALSLSEWVGLTINFEAKMIIFV